MLSRIARYVYISGLAVYPVYTRVSSCFGDFSNLLDGCNNTTGTNLACSFELCESCIHFHTATTRNHILQLG